MKFSEKWLREWVQPEVDSNTLVEQLTMLGLEVDEVEPAAGVFSKIVVGEIVAAEKHPDADKLKVCTVDTGTERLQIVCGAPNARVGLKAPLALIGAVLPGDFKIKKSKLRGVESNGMLCSEKELGLSEESDGLMELNSDAENGLDVRDLLQLDDVIIDVDLTPNRADCFCIRGVAREVAAAYQLPLQEPEAAAIPAVHDQRMKVSMQALQQCPRYISRVITGIDNNVRTPLWMVEKLRRSGIRSIHPVVDVTNYVMLELGQPMHAFDKDSIDGQIVVRMAHKDEKIQLLDQQEVTVDERYLMIADDSRPLAIAGIMGGFGSGVTEETKDIVLESAYFDPATIMGKSRELGVHTDSSMRFERGVDPELQVIAIERATQLILDVCGGSAGPVSEELHAEHMPTRDKIELTEQTLQRILGFAVESDRVEQILAGLGMQPKSTATGWQVQAPGWRFDIAIAEDLVEEVVRVLGYDAMPQIPLQSSEDIRIIPERVRQDDGIHSQLHQLGYQEVINYAFVAEKSLQQLDAADGAIALANPLSQDMAVMRTTLLPGMLANVKHNLDRQYLDLCFYEKGVVFASKGEDIEENELLLLARCGRRFPEQWSHDDAAVDFFDMKGDVENLLAGADLSFSVSEHSFLHPGRQSAVHVKHADVGIENAGWIGQLHPNVANKLKLRKDLLLAQLDMDVVRQQALPQWQSISKYPMMRRDLSVVLKEEVIWREIKQGIEAAVNDSGQSLIDVVLFDIYRGENIETGYKSLAIGMIFQEKNRTLEDKEVDKMVSKAVSFLSTKLNAEIRGGQ
ncbi:phenylalanine--tRNA ligase subunit beta [Marinicella sp. W31]|uniref:phenylalanine--tRNA ligase subunit beta n=1 Tax=Marinicella sp. W31 TaxID=3023713 RepID=UPI00375847E2